MDQENNNNNHGSHVVNGNVSKTCDCCGHGWGRGHMALRIVIGLIIAFVIFWIGIRVGEFHSEFSRGRMMFRGGYGYPGQMMRPGGFRNPGGPMIPANPGAAPATTTVQ